MGSSTREEVKLYYRIFSKEAGDAGGTTEHLLCKSLPILNGVCIMC
jgi:hypothetical protein